MATAVPYMIAVGVAASVAGTAATIAKGSPKIPAPPAPTTTPNIDAFRRKNSSSMAPGAALAGNSSTLAGGSGPSQSVGTSTLLGQ